MTGRAAALVAAACLAAGCSIKKLTIDNTAALMREGNKSINAESDVELARAAVPGQLKTIDGLLVSAPRHRVLLEIAARGYLELAFGFLEDELESLPEKDLAARRVTIARATAMYDRSFVYSLRLLETHDPRFRAAVERGGDALEAAVGRLPAAALPALTYGGLALASASNLNRGDPARIADLPRARVFLERARLLDPRFYFGGASMALGAMETQAGHHDRARDLFREAIAVSDGKYLMPRVMMARTLLVERRDRAAFEKTLEAALAAPADALPEARLANELARRRASRYLARTRELFH